MIDPLTPDQFEHLTEGEQAMYLDALGKVLGAWTLNPKQVVADQLADRVDHLLYGGAAGGGKSEWIMHRVNRLSLEVPGHASLVLRSSFPELRRSLIRRSIPLFARNPIDVRPKWRPGDKEWRYPNGSVIEFGFCESDDDVGQYLSAEYDLIAFDELTEFSLYQFDMISTRLRTTLSKIAAGSRPHVIAATNPGMRGHSWVKKYFVTASDYGAITPVYVTGQIEDDTLAAAKRPTGADDERVVGFVPATVLDNPHIDPTYVRNLMSKPETIRRQYLEGDWDVFAGQYFTEFKRVTVDAEGVEHPHHVVEPFHIPQSWPRIRGIDWGYTAPFCCLWAAFDEEGTCWVYREAYAAGLTPVEQAERVLESSVMTINGQVRPEKVDYTMADPASWSQRGTPGASIAQQWAVAGLHARKADNDRLAGWNRLREYLKTDAAGNPGIRIFSSCEALVRTLPEMIHAKNNPEDLDTTLEDHAADTLRYLLMSRPRRIHPKTERPDPATAEGRSRLDWERAAKRTRKGERVRTEIGSY